MTWRCLTGPALAVGILCSILCGTGMAELSVEGVPRWGFDGRARAERFNLLTVDVFNDGEEAWQGDLVLQALGGLQKVDIPIRQPDVYVGPFGTRRIQFLVFLSEPTDFELSWGRRNNQRLTIDAPRISTDPGIVQFLADDRVAGAKAAVPGFIASAFPISVAGIAGLDAVLLDHVPAWDQPRQRAFHDWLRRGGELHLFSSSGEQVEFPPELAALNEPSDDFPVGSGRVVRHPLPIQRATREFVSANLNTTVPEDPDSQPAVTPSWQLTTSILSALKKMTRPNHNWSLIYLMAVVYLLLIFPGCWYIGRKRGDFRLTYGALLSVVFLFSVGFSYVGRRGYGEQTSTHSVAIARSLGEGRYDVLQWTDLFVTNGGPYLIQHPYEGLVYGSGQLNEGVRGQALNRPQGMMLADIPSFSSRTIVHAGVARSINLDVDLVPDTIPKDVGQDLTNLGGMTWQVTGDLDGLVIKDVFAEWRDRFHDANYQAGGTITVAPVSYIRSDFLDESKWRTFTQPWSNQTQTIDESFEQLSHAVIAAATGVTHAGVSPVKVGPANRLRLYLWTEMRSEFHASVDASSSQFGRVLYVFEFPDPWSSVVLPTE